ncbi:MAG: DUF448 domain-containing protein [Actinobacteria bacterium]|nr:DUF448 domain-containing protein [Actinomycetota bacterium]
MDRIAARTDGSLAVGRTEPGRGAWLCAGAPACFAAATRRGALVRALRRSVSGDEMDGLRARLYGAAPSAGRRSNGSDK